MAQDMYTMTPGSAVAEQIQAILKQRRDEQRQAMIDRLNAENVQSEIGTRAAGIEAEKQRIGISKAAEERAKQMDLENILHQRFGEIPDEASPSSLSQELYARAKSAGRIAGTPAATPKVTTTTMMSPPEGASPQALEEWAKSVENQQETSSAGPQIPAGERFIGSPAYEKERRQEADMDAAIAALTADKNADPSAIRAALLTRGGLAQGVPAAAMGGRPSVTPISPQGRAMPAIELPFGGQGMEMNYPPVPPGAYITPQQVVVPNPSEGNKPWMYWVRPGEPGPGQPGSKAQPIGPFIPGETGKTPTVSQQQVAALAPAQLWTNYTNAYSRRPNETQDAWANRIAQARATLAANINARATTPEARQFINDAIGRLNQADRAGQPPPSLENIIQNARARINGLTEEEETAIRIFMSGIINGGVQQ